MANTRSLGRVPWSFTLCSLPILPILPFLPLRTPSVHGSFPRKPTMTTRSTINHRYHIRTILNYTISLLHGSKMVKSTYPYFVQFSNLTEEEYYDLTIFTETTIGRKLCFITFSFQVSWRRAVPGRLGCPFFIQNT